MIPGGPRYGPTSWGVTGFLRCCYLCGVRRPYLLGSSVWGPVGVAHPFHPSLRLGGVLVRFCGGPRCPLAVSCACPPHFFESVSFVYPVCLVAPLTPCLRWRYPSFARGHSCGWGVSPCGGFRQSPWDSR